MSKKALIFAGIAILGLGLFWFMDVSRNKKPVSTSETGSESAVSEPTKGPVGDNKVSPAPSEYTEIADKYPPAECLLTGSINYVEPKLYENKEAGITYKNVDSKARHIIWTISPQDDLSVGPNLFASLPLPDGTEDVTVGLPENPKSKSYILAAKVTYGRFIRGNLEIKEANCAGQISVEIAY